MTLPYYDWLLLFARQLCRCCASADVPGPLYVLDQSVVTPILGPAEHSIGWTSKGLAWVLRDVIGAGWQGAGPVLVIDVGTLYDGFHMPQQADDFEAWLFGVALHELSHAIEAGPEPTDEPSAFRLEHNADLVRRSMAEPYTGQEHDAHHGPGFWRIAAHLHHRAEVLKVDAFWPAILPLVDCPVGPWVVKRALADEVRECATRPIRDVLLTDPPAEFTALITDATRRAA